MPATDPAIPTTDHGAEADHGSPASDGPANGAGSAVSTGHSVRSPASSSVGMGTTQGIMDTATTGDVDTTRLLGADLWAATDPAATAGSTEPMIHYFDLEIDDVIQIGDIAEVMLVDINLRLDHTGQFMFLSAAIGTKADRSVKIDRAEIRAKKKANGQC